MQNKGLSLKIIILTMSVLMAAVPVIIFGIIELDVAARRASADAQDFIENDILATQRNIQNTFIDVQEKVKSNLLLAEITLHSSGDIYLDMDNIVEMEIKNPVSNESSQILLPVMMAGEQVLNKNYNIVDEIHNYVGGTATIFQVTPDGLLRISTNVLDENFSRVVGTYISKDSDIYNTVMNGDTFFGRTSILNTWYITAYAPMTNQEGFIIGVLYVGIEEAPYKKKVFIDLAQKVLGNSGYYEIVNSSGKYEMYQDGGINRFESINKSIVNVADADGENILKKMIDSAVNLYSGEIGTLKHNWKESEDGGSRERTSTYVYFKPWNWIVIANIYNDDLVRERVGEDLIRIVLIIVIFSVIGIFTAIFLAHSIAGPLIYTQNSVERISSGNFANLINIRTRVKELKLLGNSLDTELIPKISRIVKEILNSVAISGNINKIMQNYSKDAERISGKINYDVDNIEKDMASLDNQILEVSSAASEILATIENLVSQVSNQSSAVTETSAAMEEMTASINSIARIAAEKSDSTRVLIATVENGRNKVSISNEQIKNISTDVDNMMDIIGVINGVAAQTNLLAMNAAIEAAHAGEYGMGFSVVADEIRKLAESTALNAKVISNSLKEAVTKMDIVLNAGEESEKAFMNVAEEVTNFVNAFTEISHSTNEVSEGNKEILNAVKSLMQISLEISDGSSEIKISSQDINKSVNTIKEASRRVVNEVLRVKTGAEEITDTQKDIIEIVEWNNRNIGNIERDMKYFKLKEDINVSRMGLLNLHMTDILIHHHAWTDEAFEAMEGRHKIDINRAAEFKTCRLGKWLDGEGKELFSDNEHYNSIFKEHKGFHSEIVALVENIESGNKDAVFSNYSQIRNYYNKIVIGFRKLINE